MQVHFFSLESGNKNKAITSLLHRAYATRSNNINESISLANEALEQSEQEGLKNLVAESLSKLAFYQMIKGNFRLSTELSEKAIAYFEELNDEKGIADAKFNIASVHYKTDNLHLGLIFLIDCLQIYKKYNDHNNIGKVYKSLGTVYEYFGDRKSAIIAYEETIKHAQIANDKNLESNVYNPLSGIYLKQGEVDLAFETAEKSICMKKETNDSRGIGFGIYARAKVYAALGKFELAESDYQEAISIHTRFNELLGMAMGYRKLGEMYLQCDQFDNALEMLTKAHEFSYKNNISIIKYKSNYHLYQLYKRLNHNGKSLQYLEEYTKQKEFIIKNQTLSIIDNFELLNKVEATRMEFNLQKERAEMLENKNKAENLAKTKQDFLSTMSHEIRTPLNAIITIASLLESGANAENLALVNSLKFASNNLLTLINDILDFTKLESGKMQLTKSQCDLKLLIQNIHQTYLGLALEKGLNFQLNIDKGLHLAYELDETWLTQILSNLIGNAIKYTYQGNVVLSIKVIQQFQEEDMIRLSVEDTGIGIDKKDQAEIFDSFSQMQDIRTRKQGGSGLGLAIVKKLVELHQSQIKLMSEEGNGSVFYFDIRLKKSERKISTQIKNEVNLKDKNILLVEDNYINALVANKLLGKWEMKITHVVNGLQAIEKAAEEKYDAILMDIHLPEMDGFEATEWIRLNKNFNSETPILALTADITAESDHKNASFFTAFLRKPIETDKLFDSLVKFIQ